MDRVLFDHVAVALSGMADATAFLSGELGGVPDAGQPSGLFTWGTYRFEGGGSIEVMEPVGPSGFLHRFLSERGAPSRPPLGLAAASCTGPRWRPPHQFGVRSYITTSSIWPAFVRQRAMS